MYSYRFALKQTFQHGSISIRSTRFIRLAALTVQILAKEKVQRLTMENENAKQCIIGYMQMSEDKRVRPVKEKVEGHERTRLLGILKIKDPQQNLEDFVSFIAYGKSHFKPPSPKLTV